MVSAATELDVAALNAALDKETEVFNQFVNITINSGQRQSFLMIKLI